MSEDRSVDVTLLLEGTYPYVRGGVSSWVHEMVSGLSELSFGLVFLGSQREDYTERQYRLPPNVSFLEERYLMDFRVRQKPRSRRGNAEAFGVSERLHEAFKNPSTGDVAENFDATVQELGRSGGITQDDFLHSEASWDQLVRSYRRYCTDPSFVDYFWTVRNMHAPLFDLVRLARELAPTRVVHSISTGYAGLLAAMLARQRGVPCVITEHGIYTKERKIDLSQAEWIKEPEHTVGASLHDDVSYIRRMWIRFFEQIGRLGYAAADPVISLYEGNRERQIRDGAPAERTRVIPNGIDVERYQGALAARSGEAPPVVALVGRVVPIKDIKTFVRAMRGVVEACPGAEGWIVGPEDEDPDYSAECRALIDSLELGDSVHLMGFRDIPELLPRIGVMALTSISEALPLVVLEAFAGGVPVVSTDVGACRELIEGGDAEDRAIGTAGRVTPIASPEATAAAVSELLTDDAAWAHASAAGLERVRRYYTRARMFDHYRTLYRDAIAG